jgi:hypothetical protein
MSHKAIGTLLVIGSTIILIASVAIVPMDVDLGPVPALSLLAFAVGIGFFVVGRFNEPGR